MPQHCEPNDAWRQGAFFLVCARDPIVALVCHQIVFELQFLSYFQQLLETYDGSYSKGYS